jgi:phage shock protein A
MADEQNIANKYSAELSKRLETDLSDMDYETAHNYVVSYITEFKEIQKKTQSLLDEKKIWEDRHKLAVDKNKSDLAGQALEKIKDIDEKKVKYVDRGLELKVIIEILKDQLNKLSVSSTNQFDAEKILAELQLMSDDAFIINKDITDIEIQDQLDKLKSNLNK